MLDIDLIKRHEGCTLTAKPDAKGKWSIGWGHDIAAPQDQTMPPTCTQDQADDWLDDDAAGARSRAANDVGSAWAALGDERKSALTDMAYELGGAGLGGFHDMLSSIRAGNFIAAAFAGVASHWDEQVPHRAAEDMIILATGVMPDG